MTDALAIRTGGELRAMPETSLVSTLSIDQVLARVEAIKTVMSKVMVDGVHYGASYPGDKKKNLLKPGAEILAVTFQLYPEFDILERDLGNGHREYRICCTMKTQATGATIAQGVGLCSTMEKKYRWRIKSRVCPTCGVDAIRQSKEEWGGGFYCNAKGGGCGAKFPKGDRVITDQETGKEENKDIADVHNTCLKIAKKRAQVDATITACGASGYFSQDAEDFDHALADQRKKEDADAIDEMPAPKAAAPASTPPSAQAAAATGDKKAEASAMIGGAKLAMELMDGIQKATTSDELAAAWKRVTAEQKGIDGKSMREIRDAWQARLQEPKMARIKD